MGNQKVVAVRELVEELGLKQLTGNDEALDRDIEVPEIFRPGFELAGYYQLSDFRRIAIFGEKEISYISTLNPNEQRGRFEHLSQDISPCIVIAKGKEIPKYLKEVAEAKNYPVLGTDMATGKLSSLILSFLEHKLAPETLMHGVLMNIYGKGVIIKGESGIGKSEIALELIKRGHLLVADDAIELFRIGQNISGRSPEVLNNLLEIRGVGVIDVVKMFGVGSVLTNDVVEVIIQLERWIPSKEYARVGVEQNNLFEDVLEIKIPKMVIPVTSGRSMAAIIEAAVMNERLKELGYDSGQEFIERILANIESKKIK